MAGFSSNLVFVFGFATALAGGVLVWSIIALLTKLHRLERKVAELSQSKRVVLDELRLEAHQVSYNVSLLTKQATRDNLDALRQQSTPLLLEALKESGALELVLTLVRAGMLK